MLKLISCYTGACCHNGNISFYILIEYYKSIELLYLKIQQALKLKSTLIKWLNLVNPTYIHAFLLLYQKSLAGMGVPDTHNIIPVNWQANRDLVLAVYFTVYQQLFV